MNKSILVFIGFFAFCCQIAVAQNGIVRGVVMDEESQEPLIGGVVQLEGTGLGAVTDFEGTYSIEAPAGTYSVIHTYVGYQDKVISEVEVIEGEVNSLGQINLGFGDGNELDAVVVTAYVQKNSEEGLLNYQRESTKIVDAVSAQSIAKTGDSDVAAVVKRVPGVTVENGKYVYVRGLGDRYSKSILNGMEIPGLDPERNTVQMDIFPSNIIDNIVVYKTFSPDLPGDFTGGMVDVITKDFPLEKTFNVSASLGFNTETTFNDNYIGFDDNSFTDIIGFGNKDREVPVSADFNPQNASRSAIFDATDQLNKSAAVTPQENFLNQKLSISYGNQLNIGKNQLGFTAAVNYKNNYSQNSNWIRNDLFFSNDIADLSQSELRAGSVAGNDGLLNGLLNTAFKFERGKVGLKLIHTRTGENNVSQRIFDDQFDDQVFDESIIDYFQRSISNGVLRADFYLGEDQDIVLDASVAGTISEIFNPERTNTSMFVDPTDNSFTFASNSEFKKEWRELTEDNYNGKVNVELPIFRERSLESKLKFGGGYNYKERFFEPFQIEIAPSNFFDASLSKIPNNDLDLILLTENIVTETEDGYGINTVQIDEENKFDADMSITAGYLMADHQFTDKFKFIGGLRVENAIMNFDGFEAGQPLALETLNSTQLLPSVNLVYELKDYMNLRGSYNRTLARPSFKEKSELNIFDVILNQFFIGNLDLVETEINNYDLRWEYYFDATEMISISPFYKQFTNPIEMSFINSLNVTPINKDEADVLGFEFELRKDFEFLGEGWENLSTNANFTFVDSNIDFTPNELLKYNNVDVPNNRELVGQAPYTINTSFNYATPGSGWEGNLGYNVKGKTLTAVGFSTVSHDVYEDPFHNLDFKLSKRFGGQDGRSKLSLTAGNLLNDNIEYVYEIRDIETGIFNSFDVGQTFSLGYSVDIR